MYMNKRLDKVYKRRQANSLNEGGVKRGKVVKGFQRPLSEKMGVRKVLKRNKER